MAMKGLDRGGRATHGRVRRRNAKKPERAAAAVWKEGHTAESMWGRLTKQGSIL